MENLRERSDVDAPDRRRFQGAKRERSVESSDASSEKSYRDGNSARDIVDEDGSGL